MVYSTQEPTAEELDELYGSYPIKAALSPITRKRFAELLRSFEPFRSTGHILDVGSGSGFFLDVAMEMKWDAHGVEYDPSIVKACVLRGMKMQQGALDVSHYQEGSFDVLTSFEVLEHLIDPRAEIEKFHALIRPGGLLYATTPNYNSVSRWLAHPSWNIINYPEHLNYFTPRTLDRILSENGFIKERLVTTGISVSRVRSSITGNQQENIDPNNDDERLRGRIESSRFLLFGKRSMNAALSLMGMGDSLKAMYRKKG